MAPLYGRIEGTIVQVNLEQEKLKAHKIHIIGRKERWREVQEEYFTDLIFDLASPTLLVAYERGEIKRLITDASGIGYGAVLL